MFLSKTEERHFPEKYLVALLIVYACHDKEETL